MKYNRPMRLRSVLLLALFAPCLGATPAAVVTTANLLEREQFWPYRVTLTEAWQPPGREAPLSAGSTGVLIRVDTGGAARIDFSSDGKYEVPIEKTDLVANGNRIARGELEKDGPNFFRSIGARLIDSDANPPTSLRADTIADRQHFLCVFADPSAKDFAELVAALRPYRARNGTQTLLFPQGSHPDSITAERLRMLDWRVPFVYAFLSEPYTHTLVRDGTTFPTVMLVTNEGRLLYQGTATSDLAPELDAAFAAMPAERTPHR